MNNALFNRWLPAATLAAWGGVIVYYWASGRLEALLKGEFQLYAMIAAVLLLIGAVIIAFSSAETDCCADSACSHAMGRSKTGRLLTFAIILLPIALKPFGSASALQAVQGKNRISTDDFTGIAASIKEDYKKNLAARAAATPTPSSADNLLAPGPISPPPPLPLPMKEGEAPPAATAAQQPPGSQPPAPAAEQKHPAAAEQSSFADYLQRSPEGNIMAEVLDLLYAAQDNVLRKDFEEKTIELVVQFMPDTSAEAPANRFKGVRMFMTCCAADSRPIATLIEANAMPQFPEMTWVKVTGTATFPVEKGRRVSVIRAQKVEKTEPPAESMLN